MQNATERRQRILEALSDRRQDTLEHLAYEFDVSIMTIRRDVQILSCSVPMYTQQGNGGGVRVQDGYYFGRRYLHNEQEDLLRKLLLGLQPEQQEVMQSILRTFAKPIVKES